MKRIHHLISLCAIILFALCSPKKTEVKSCFTLKAEDFKKTINGKPTNLYFLKNGNIQAAITKFIVMD